MLTYLLTDTRKRQYMLLAGDVALLVVCLLASYSIRLSMRYDAIRLDLVWTRVDPMLGLVILVHVLTIYLFDQYSLKQLAHRFRASVLLVMSSLLAGVLLSAILFFFPKYILGRQVMVINVVVSAVALVAWRSMGAVTLFRNGTPKKIAVVGHQRMIEALCSELRGNPFNGYRVTCICHPGECHGDTYEGVDADCRRSLGIAEMLESAEWDILAFDSTCGQFTDGDIQRILQLKYRGKSVCDVSTLYESLTGKVPLFHVDGRWILSREGLQGGLSLSYRRMKRVFDIVLSSVGLLVTWPIMAVVAVLIRIESRGPVLYRQERLGLAKKSFVCLKFRTMVEDAELDSGPVHSSVEDPRVTRLGRFLRKSRLDELPQLFNILAGEMSFVGPRPIREHFALQMAEVVPFYWLRYDVKPGVTGWAQSNGVYAVPNGLEAFQYELFYIQHMSILFDLMIMLRTAKVMLWGKGK